MRAARSDRRATDASAASSERVAAGAAPEIVVAIAPQCQDRDAGADQSDGVVAVAAVHDDARQAGGAEAAGAIDGDEAAGLADGDDVGAGGAGDGEDASGGGSGHAGRGGPALGEFQQ